MKFVPKKSLGQNFLVNEEILNQIVDLGNINSNDIVLEVGPGTGNLTEKILNKKPKKLILVEKDKNLSLVNLKLKKIEESLYSKEVNWSELNEYWTDEKGYVWISRQSISPRLPPIYYEVTKKPR